MGMLGIWTLFVVRCCFTMHAEALLMRQQQTCVMTTGGLFGFVTPLLEVVRGAERYPAGQCCLCPERPAIFREMCALPLPSMSVPPALIGAPDMLRLPLICFKFITAAAAAGQGTACEAPPANVRSVH